MAGTIPDKLVMLRTLISTTRLLNHARIRQLSLQYPKYFVKESVKTELQSLREKILHTPPEMLSTIDMTPDGIAQEVENLVQAKLLPTVRSAINASGIILHTGLGRSPFSEDACEALQDAVRGYSTLDIDVATGKRGSRESHVEELLQQLTGAEACCIVNNNAAAVLLVLNTLADGKEVIISRGQAVEIGGEFRIPDIMHKSQAVMVDVGTTNRTRFSDYENAVTPRTGLIQVAHTSNYRIVGFVQTVGIAALAPLCHTHNIPLVVDLGSGCLGDLTRFGLPEEPVAGDAIRDGADIVTFSGDKILGGPQCGLIIGKRSYIETIRKNPLARVLREDKMTYAVLEATLKMFLEPDTLPEKHPIIHMMAVPVTTIGGRARRFVRSCAAALREECDVAVVPSESHIGGGSMPASPIPTRCVALKPRLMSVDDLGNRLRGGNPPVFARIHEDQLLLDFRTIHPREIPRLRKVLVGIFTA